MYKKQFKLSLRMVSKMLHEIPWVLIKARFKRLNDAVVSGGAGDALAPPEYGSSVNPIPTRDGRLCPPHYC